jgi:hypothetical protein
MNELEGEVDDDVVEKDNNGEEKYINEHLDSL